MTDNRQSDALSTPPEGVVAGESIPRENEEDDIDESKIEELIGHLKSKGEPWSKMSDDEIRRTVKDRLVERGVIQ